MAFHTRRADILIVAAGKPRAVTADMVKEGDESGMLNEVRRARLCG